MKKKLFIYSLLLTGVATALSGCSFNINPQGVRGSGEIESRDFDVEDYTAINVSGVYEVVWQESETASVTIEMYENLFEFLEVSVQGDTLYIDSTRSINVRNNDTVPRIYLYSPSLETVSFYGALTAENWDTVHAQNFSLNVSGAASADLDLNVEVLDVDLSGAGDLDLTGNIDTANLVVSGAGNIDIDVIDYLNVTLSGVGRVRYGGNPTITRNILGVGTLEQK